MLSVLFHTYSLPNDPIVSGFIAQSPYNVKPASPTDFAYVATTVGCANGTEAQVFQCLMNTDAQLISQGMGGDTLHLPGMPPGSTPVVDNITIWSPGGYLEQADKGKF